VWCVCIFSGVYACDFCSVCLRVFLLCVCVCGFCVMCVCVCVCDVLLWDLVIFSCVYV